jgi:pSer/pThr/pTyr-binding forkhead associated (FHA) protein
VYVFDLNSTHGTFVNKIKIKPEIYVQIRDGGAALPLLRALVTDRAADQLRFGSSTRIFILTGGPPPPVTGLSLFSLYLYQNAIVKPTGA